MTKKSFSQKGFRDTLGQFATGVTIITTLDAESAPVGITVSSFNSVSMDPPLILWSLAKDAYSLSCFQKAEYFNIHILAVDQEDMSNRFARPGTAKFDNIDFNQGLGGSPILKNCAAILECRTRHQYDGGDHIIFVGEVLVHSHSTTAPLIFHRGQYASTQPKAAG